MIITASNNLSLLSDAAAAAIDDFDVAAFFASILNWRSLH